MPSAKTMFAATSPVAGCDTLCWAGSVGSSFGARPLADWRGGFVIGSVFFLPLAIQNFPFRAERVLDLTHNQIERLKPFRKASSSAEVFVAVHRRINVHERCESAGVWNSLNREMESVIDTVARLGQVRSASVANDRCGFHRVLSLAREHDRVGVLERQVNVWLKVKTIWEVDAMQHRTISPTRLIGHLTVIRHNIKRGIKDQHPESQAILLPFDVEDFTALGHTIELRHEPVTVRLRIAPVHPLDQVFRRQAVNSKTPFFASKHHALPNETPKPELAGR